MIKTIYEKVFMNYWNPYVAVSLAGVLSAFYFAVTGTVWAVTGEFTRYGGHVLAFFGVDISDWAYFNLVSMEGTSLTRTDGWIIIGMFAGALITVLLSKNFKIRVPQQKRRYVQAFIGGFIAGFGARLALGCNLAAFFTGIPQFSFHSWIFMVTTAIGTYAGVKVINTRWWRGKPNLQMKRKTAAQAKAKPENKRSLQVVLGLLVALAFAVVLIGYTLNGKGLLAAAGLFGIGFGVLIERGQICFTSAFRDLWVSGRTVMTKALAFGVLISVILTFIFLQTGMTSVIKVSAPSTVIGGLLFGFGIVLAGGCETGWMYRAMEGQVLFWVVGLGNVIGATVLAYAWDHLGLYQTMTAGWPKLDLIAAWGPYQALFATFLLLGLWMLAAIWWEKHYRYGKGLDLRANGQVIVPQSAKE